MTQPLWRELIKQDALEAQYEVLKTRGYSDHDIAIHLARFAEARMFNAADRRITKLEKKLATVILQRDRRRTALLMLCETVNQAIEFVTEADLEDDK